MNAKKAKLMRKMANAMHNARMQESPDLDVSRKLLVKPTHEGLLKEQHEVKAKSGRMGGFVTAVNNPNSVRGIGRWLKKYA